MNLSGTAVLDFVLDNSIDVKEILVIVDDVNLSLGKIRLRKSGSDGGHNGLKSIIYSLQDNSFPRLRFGVGSQFQKGELSGYVLDKFSKSELDTIYESLGFSQELIYEFIIGGYNSMLNFFSKQNKIKKSQQQESLE
jgi:PTH1 family peptidyl-tRNA hydrolase